MKKVWFMMILIGIVSMCTNTYASHPDEEAPANKGGPELIFIGDSVNLDTPILKNEIVMEFSYMALNVKGSEGERILHIDPGLLVVKTNIPTSYRYKSKTDYSSKPYRTPRDAIRSRQRG